MAVSKRTRFEVLKRDDYTCRYCRSTENELTIDHVSPVALGGSDSPENLVAACRDCNYGKSSTSPDAPTVADVAQDALRWAAAMKLARAQVAAETEHRLEYIDFLVTHWEAHLDGTNWLPEDYELTFGRWFKDGVPIEFVTEAITIASVRRNVDWSRAMAYVAGVVRSMMEDLHNRSQRILAEGS